MDRMKEKQQIQIIVSIILIISNTECQSSCQGKFDGFSLIDSYNRNSPPSQEFDLKIEHALLSVDEVS